MMNIVEATGANEEGHKLAQTGDYAAAIRHYLEAVRLAPSWSAPWFNLGIAYKHTGDFAGSLRASEKALAIDREAAGEGAIWNVGIAATALGDWAKARQAWKAFGIAIGDGEGPIDMGGVATPIRLNPRGNAEVVWTLRIDPARARIRSIPLPASGHRYDDLLLHDGAPNGYRKFQGQDVPVFDELTLLEHSSYETRTIALVAPTAEDVDDLIARLREARVPAEDWTGSVRMLCEKCSTGTPHAHHGDELAPRWNPKRNLAVALQGTAPLSVLDAWASSAEGRAYEAPVSPK
jgi:tetratricopeptide (TPR) repeat protein